MNKRLGRNTVELANPPHIISSATVVGAKEGAGPLYNYFDMIVSDDKMGQKSWDLAEGVFIHSAVELVLKKAALKKENIDYAISGDLQNQCIASHYGLRDTHIPYLGLYGACSTMVESLSLGAMLISGSFAKKVLCVTSSHFCSAEKQYRTPLEYGGQRTPSAQWTVTGSGAAVLATNGNGPIITHVTTGEITDKGVKDITNMGAAMAPAACNTLTAHFKATNTNPEDYDMILTGDLGYVGSDLLYVIMDNEGFDIRKNHNDCGKMIYAVEAQDVHAGGSGCGCCASVLCGYILNKMNTGVYNKILVAATGALMNPLTVQQGESIPTISHAIVISNC